MNKLQMQSEITRLKLAAELRETKIQTLENQLKCESGLEKVSSFHLRNLEEVERQYQKLLIANSKLEQKCADYSEVISEQSKAIVRLVNKTIPQTP